MMGKPYAQSGCGLPIGSSSSLEKVYSSVPGSGVKPVKVNSGARDVHWLHRARAHNDPVMRLKRRKVYRRHLRFFKLNFGIRAPYEVLVDGTFLHAGLQKKLELARLVSDILDATDDPQKSAMLVTTSAVVRELRSLGPDFAETASYASSLKQLRIGGKKGVQPDQSAASVIRKLVGQQNRHGYVVATQDEELRGELRSVPGVPLIYIARTMLVLEAPSPASQQRSEKIESRKRLPSKVERKALQNTAVGRQPAPIAASGAEAPSGVTPGSKLKRKRAGPKQPNPLSCKKARRKELAAAEDNSEKKRGRRRRNRKRSDCGADKGVARGEPPRDGE